MIYDTLNKYDTFALEVYWEGTKNFDKKPQIVQSFLRKFFSKYQIAVLCEEGYTRDDRMDRIQYILNNTPGLSSLLPLSSVEEMRDTVKKLLDDDIKIISGMTEERIPPPQVAYVAPQAVMGFDDEDDEDSLKREKEREIRYLLGLDLDRKPDGRARTSEEKQQVYKEEGVSTRNEHIEKKMDLVIRMLQRMDEENSKRQADIARTLEEKSTVHDSGSQLDGDSLIKMEKINKKMLKEIVDLNEKTLGGQSWDTVSLKDIPGWLKLNMVAGLKRMAIATMYLPLTGPTFLVNRIIVRPLKASFKQIGSVYNIIETIWGFCLIGIVVGGTLLIFTSDKYDAERRNIYALYDTFNTYVPVSIIIEPSKKTLQVMWDYFPLQKILPDILDLFKQYLYQFGNILVGWFKDLITYIFKDIAVAIAKEVVTQTPVVGGLFSKLF